MPEVKKDITLSVPVLQEGEDNPRMIGSAKLLYNPGERVVWVSGEIRDDELARYITNGMLQAVYFGGAITPVDPAYRENEPIENPEPPFSLDAYKEAKQAIYDAVKTPEHYKPGTSEVANFIADQELDFVRGNVVKYISRAGKKDPSKEVQDIEKAAAYLQMAHNLANGLPAVVRDPETSEVVWTLFK